MICQTERLGLRSLLKCAGLENKPVSAGDVAFKIVPRINAMGRMGSSERAVRLFLSDYEQEADEIAEQMNEENSARQQEEVKILRELSSQIEQEPDRLLDRVLVFWGEGWHQGVLGIVSSRVTEKYGKPSVILSTCGTEAKGSARSIPGFSIHEALTSCQELLTKYGGHTLAAGMTLPVENLPAFRQALNETAAEREEEVYPVLSIDLKLKPSLVGLDTVKQMEALAPFGAGNPTPVFGLYHMRLEEIVPLSGGKHLRLSFSREETRISALRFGMGPEEFPYSKGDILDLAVNLERSEYRGQEQVSILIKDMKPAGLENEELLGQKSRYEAFRRGDRVPGEKLLSMIPTREETGAVYRLLRGEQRREAWNLFSMCNCLRKAKIGYDKLMISLHMMEDVGLLSFRTDGERAQIRLAKVERKADLEASPTLQKLRRLTA